MSRIIYDGLNLSLAKGTGISTYTRHLTKISRSLGHDVGVLYSIPFKPAREAALREIIFFDEMTRISRRRRGTTIRRWRATVADLIKYQFEIHPESVDIGKVVIAREFEHTMAEHDRAFVERNLFLNAANIYNNFKKFSTMSFDPPPDIFHCTYPMPIRAKSARNICTIHDLVPLQLPHATGDNKKRIFGLLKRLAEHCDHIVTVSETSRKDIIDILGVPPNRVTNTYQMVEFPKEYLEPSEDVLANLLDRAYGLAMRGYLLFFGALEPKKNVRRLIEAYLSSGVTLPLVLVASEGWQNEAEKSLLAEHVRSIENAERIGPVVRRLDYVGMSTLVALIRGARAVVFPSLYEGFGLPVVEAMSVGTPVVTSNTPALKEVTAEAALLVDPYSVSDIAKGIQTIASDQDLCRELSRRGRVQAGKFSASPYRERIGALYASLA